jgi:methionyl-tRNA formyltransferase
MVASERVDAMLNETEAATRRLDRLIFFGTPAFAIPTLDALATAGRTPIVVVSQPARGAGRGRALHKSPVMAWAERHGVRVLAPERVKEPAFLATIRELEPDIAVVVAFGQIFPAGLLALPRFGCVNLHASLLPKYRGAAPVAAAIAAGEEKTGVCTMLMEAGMDTGPVLRCRELPIGSEETCGELAERLAQFGAGLVVETLAAIASNNVTPRAQDDSAASYAPRLKKEDGAVSFEVEANVVFNRLRAYTPWPGLTTSLRGQALKLVWGRPAERATAAGSVPGTILGLAADDLLVACGQGTCFAISRVQRPGRSVVSGRELWNGERLASGERLGETPRRP